MIGFKYFLTIVDDPSRYCYTYLMRLKYETSIIVKKIVSFIKTQFNTNIKTIRIDNGPKFFLRVFFTNNGIIHQTSVFTPLNKTLLLKGSTNTF